MEGLQEANKGKPCPLCNLPDTEVLMEFPRWRVARTKTMKGHKERIMLYHKDHVKTLDEQSVGEAFLLLMAISQKFFSHAKQWAIFEPVYATVPDHWHRVASDLDPGSEDHEQILKTPRLVIDTEHMTISRASAEPVGRFVETRSFTDRQGAQPWQFPFGFSDTRHADGVSRPSDDNQRNPELDGR